jgi:hypothetical protein
MNIPSHSTFFVSFSTNLMKDIFFFIFFLFFFHSVLYSIYFHRSFIFRIFRLHVLRNKFINYLNDDNLKIIFLRKFSPLSQDNESEKLSGKDKLAPEPEKVNLSSTDDNLSSKDLQKVNHFTDFIFSFRDRLFSFFSTFPLFLSLWDSRFLFSDAFLISTLCLIIFKFLSFLFLGHYPIIFINIFFLFFFALIAYKYSLMIKFKTLIVKYIYCNFSLTAPITVCWFMEDEEDDEMRAIISYYPDLFKHGEYFEKTKLQLIVENFFYFLILLRLFVLSERFFYLIARFFFVYFLLFNHYYTLVAIIGIIGVLSRVQFYMSDWNREEMRKTYDGMVNEFHDEHMLDNYDKNDPIIIAPTWNNSKIMYYITIRNFVKYFTWARPFVIWDYEKVDHLPITRDDIMKKWNRFIIKPSNPFDFTYYGFQQGLYYNQIVGHPYKSVPTLPYRNFLFLSLLYISILIGITYGILDEDIMNLVTEIIIIPAKKVLSQVRDNMRYKYRPLSQEFPQSSIYFSPSTVGNLALDIPRKLIYIVTKGPLYSDKTSTGRAKDMRNQLSHPTTVGFLPDGSIFTQAQGTIKFKSSSQIYPLEAFSYNKNSQTFYGISPHAIIYNPQHPEYAALRNHIYEKSTDWEDQTHALMLTEGKIGVKGIYVPGELELQFANIAEDFINSSPAASLPIEIREKFHAVLRGEMHELPGLKALCENLGGNHNAPLNMKKSCNKLLKLLKEMNFNNNSIINDTLSQEGLSSFTFNDISPLSTSTNEITLVDKKGISGGKVKGFIATEQAFIKYDSGEPIPLISCTEKGEVKNEIIIKRNDHEYKVEKERVKTINLGVRGIKVPGAESIERNGSQKETPKIAKKEEIE